MSAILLDLSLRSLGHTAQNAQLLRRPDKVGKRVHPHILHNVTPMSLNCLLCCTQFIGSAEAKAWTRKPADSMNI